MAAAHPQLPRQPRASACHRHLSCGAHAGLPLDIAAELQDNIDKAGALPKWLAEAQRKVASMRRMDGTSWEQAAALQEAASLPRTQQMHDSLVELSAKWFSSGRPSPRQLASTLAQPAHPPAAWCTLNAQRQLPGHMLSLPVHTADVVLLAADARAC